MTKWLIMGGLAALLTGIYWYIGGAQTLQALWLITRVEPYERLVPGAPTILVLGDSTAYGTGAASSADSIAGRIAASYPEYSVVTKAQNGLTTAGARERLREWLGDEQYALVLWQVGANDVIRGVPLEETVATMETVLSVTAEQTETVLWMSSGNIGGAWGFSPRRQVELTAAAREFRQQATLVAERAGTTYLDLFVEPAADLFIIEPDRYLAADGLHPSSAGYGVWFDELEPLLAEALE